MLILFSGHPYICASLLQAHNKCKAGVAKPPNTKICSTSTCYIMKYSGFSHGLLLFNFYIDEITRVFLTSGTMSLYVDDMMLYRQINSHADYAALKDDVNHLHVWTAEFF